MTQEREDFNSFDDFHNKYKAKYSCPKCYGRGVTGQVIGTGEWLMCKCVKKIIIPKELIDANSIDSDY